MIMSKRIVWITIVSVCLFFFVGHALAASGVYWTKSYPLQQGQAVIHQVQVDNNALFDLHSPPGAQFALYALQIAAPGAQNCPPEAVIRSMATYISQDAFVLPRGQWCIAVYASLGSGTYYLEASSVPGLAPGPIQPPTLPPTQKPIPMIPGPVKPAPTIIPNPFKPSIQTQSPSVPGPIKPVQTIIPNPFKPVVQTQSSSVPGPLKALPNPMKSPISSVSPYSHFTFY